MRRKRENKAKKLDEAVISFVSLRETIHARSPRIYTPLVNAALGCACNIQTGYKTASAPLGK